MNFEEQAALLTQSEIVSLLVEVPQLRHKNQTLEQGYKKLEQNNKYLEQDISSLKQQLEWFKRQVFGAKSERRLRGDDPKQLCLGELLTTEETPPPAKQSIKNYERQQRKAPWEIEESRVRFDESVPVEVIEVSNPELEGKIEGIDYEVISEKRTTRLAQRPSSYVVLEYVRKVVKLKETSEIVTAKAPEAVIEKSLADVSFIVGLMIDKFLYHLPLYRQHLRLKASGINLDRVTLTNLVHRSAELLEPIYNALLSSILESEVLTMDETGIKAGLGKGKMKTGYFWPVYGDKDEIAFPFGASRASKHAGEVLGKFCGVLVTDGYKVYERYAEQVNGVVHAQCWVHTRRKFVEAEGVEPELVEKALSYIGLLYDQETEVKQRSLEQEKKLLDRRLNSKLVVDEFFTWLKKVVVDQALLPLNPFLAAVNYTLKREQQLRVFLDNPEVPLDTNHLEREIRPVAIGRKNYLFCWTEVGATYAGIIYSLIASCKLQGVDPYTYLVDVLQRIDSHPMQEIHRLTPRLWKENFAKNPLRSDIDKIRQ